jgi:hypothetical protein
MCVDQCRPISTKGQVSHDRRAPRSPGALWQDLKVGIEHLRGWKRIAIVTDIEWVTHLTGLFGWMTPGETKVFPLQQRGEAIAWVAG